jgi:hypothetical protein
MSGTELEKGFDNAVAVLERDHCVPKYLTISAAIYKQYPEIVERARRAMENRFGEPVQLTVYPTLPKDVGFCIRPEAKEEEQ